MRIMISAGEASGDLLGANLAKALRTLCPEIELLGMGGQKMEAAEVRILQGIDELGVIGLFAGIGLIRKLFKIRDHMIREALENQIDALVVIDYPEYNTRFAKKIHQLGIPVVFYVSPSAWAWRKGRAKEVAKISDRVAAIFPFEAEVYEEAGAKVSYVGHPLVDIAQATMSKEEARAFFKMDPAKKQVLVMPGSRKQEIEMLLPPMVDAMELLFQNDSNLEFFLPLASTISENIIEEMIKGKALPLRIVRGPVYDLMSVCRAGMISSGTASLEAALMEVPSVIIYQISAISYWLGKKMIRLNHFGLPNIIAAKEILPELIREQVTGANIAHEVSQWLYDKKYYEQTVEELQRVKRLLGNEGAVMRAAEVVIEVAQQKKE